MVDSTRTGSGAYIGVPSIQRANQLGLWGTENELDRPLPRMLKLLYRFHDGQHLLIDEIQFSQQPASSYPEAEIIGSIFLGMFGGYNFYDELINVRLLPLKHCVMVTKMLLSNPRNTLARVDLLAYPKTSAKTNENWSKSDSVVSDPIPTLPPPPYFEANSIAYSKLISS